MALVRRALARHVLSVWPDLALLALRVWFGGLLFLLHGWMKVQTWSELSHRFADPFGIGSAASLALSMFAEVVCSSMLVLGLFTRFAALVCIINMTTAFIIGHGARLTGGHNGELAFLYLGAFVTLLLAGPGSYAMDDRR
jgi:putative oxidoreductase